MNWFVRVVVTIAVALLGPIVALADTTGSVSGLVTDPSGAVVPGVVLVATSQSTNVQHTTVTDSKGFFSFPALSVDVYNVTTSKPGFRGSLKSGIKVDTNSEIRLDFKLDVGSVAQTVRVVSVKHAQKYASFLIGYTYEKSIDNSSDSFDGINPYNPGLSRALSIFNVPQDLVASYTVQLPFNNFIGSGDVARKFTAGWPLSGISTFASGQPVLMSETDDRSLAGTFGYTLIDVPSYANNGTPLYLDRNPRKGQPYFDPNYFVLEPIGQVGDAMRRFVSGPGINNFDMALLKDTQLGETRKLDSAQRRSISLIIHSSTIRREISTTQALVVLGT
jgi:hypothetical protein